MRKKLMNWFADVLFETYKIGITRGIILIVIFSVVILPVVVIANFSYRKIHQELTQFTFSRRQAVAYLVATTVQEKLDRLQDLGISLASRIKFRELIQAGNWNDAIKTMERIIPSFPAVDRIFLSDPTGSLMADTLAVPDMLGKNFAFRDWFKGVSREWKPYVSEVYRRSAEPRYSIIAVAVPIKTDDQKLLGILVLEIRLDTLIQWTQEITKQVEIGSWAYVYIVDKNGHLAAHPKISSTTEIVDFSIVPAVREVLTGKRGVEIMLDPFDHEKHLVAFEPITKYRWGVIAGQPTRMAFALRDETLKFVLIVYLFVLFFNCCWAYLISSIIDAITTNRQRERVFVESIAYGLLVVNRDFRITLWNENASKITGWKREDVLGEVFHEFFSFVYEGDQRHQVPLIEEAMTSGKVQRVEQDMILVGKDGREVSISSSAAPMIDRWGKIIGVIVLFRDNTDRKSAEDALKVSEEHNRLILETANDAFIGMDTKGSITDWNRQAEILFGWSPQQAIGRHMAETVIPLRYRKAHRDGMERFIKTGEGPVLNKRIELTALRRNDQEFPVELTIWAVKKNNVHQFYAFIHDISERKEAESELMAAHKRLLELAAIVQSSEDAIISKNLQGIITSWNKGAERLYDYSADEVVGKSISLIIPSDRINELTYIFEQLNKRETIENYETVRVRKDGRKIFVSVTVSAIHDASGKLVGASSIARDITERKQAEEKSKEINKELTQRERELKEALGNLEKSHEELKTTQLNLIQVAKMESIGRLAAGVAHEVKNPLAIIQMAASYLSQELKNGDEKIKVVLDDVESAVQRADAIIKGLLDFSAPKEMLLKSEDLNTVIERSLLFVKHNLDRHHVNVVKDFEQDLPHLMLDRNKIEQVFINLLMNAIQAMPQGGTLTVKIYTKIFTDVRAEMSYGNEDYFKFGETVVIAEIEDTGTGIPQDKIHKIFDPFFTTKPMGQGTGLGLTVTRKIIELHQATMDIQNRLAGGGRATLMFRTERSSHA